MPQSDKHQEIVVETTNIPEAAINAHFQLIAINLGSWKPEVEEWLHSEEAEGPLQQLLAHVPCPPTLH